MNGGEDQVILVKQWDTGFVTRCRWRIERQLGEEALTIRERRGDLRELEKIGFAESSILVTPFEMRQIPPARQIKFRGPANCVAPDKAQGFGKGRPVLRT